MPFYLTNSIGKKVLISNEYLKSKLLTYSTSSNDLADIFEASRSASNQSDDLFFKKIGFKTEEISVDDCIERILENSNLSDEVISSLLVLDTNTFLTVVYCLKEGILTSRDIEEIINLESPKNRAERLISAIESVNEDLEIFDNFKSVIAEKTNNDVKSHRDVFNRLVSKDRNTVNIFPKLKEASLCFPMKDGLTLRDNFGLLKHSRWYFFHDHSYTGPKPEKVTVDIPWWWWLTPIMTIAALAALAAVAITNKENEDAYNKKVEKGRQANEAQSSLQSGFKNAMNSLYSSGDLSGRYSAESLKKGLDQIKYNTHNILNDFFNMALPELGKYLFENREIDNSIKDLYIVKLDNLFSEYLRIAGSAEINRSLENTKNNDTAVDRRAQEKQFYYSNGSREIFIPTFFSVLYRTYKNFKEGEENSGMFSKFDYANDSRLAASEFIDGSIKNPILITDYEYRTLYLYNPNSGDFESTEPFICSSEEFNSKSKIVQNDVIMVTEKDGNIRFYRRYNKDEIPEITEVYFSYPNPFFYYSYETHKKKEDASILEIELDKAIQLSLQKVLSRPFVDVPKNNGKAQFSFKDRSFISSYLMFIDEKRPEISNREQYVKELLDFALHISDSEEIKYGEEFVSEIKLNHLGLYSLSKELTEFFKVLPEIKLNSFDSESERKASIQILREEKAQFIKSKLDVDDISSQDIIKWVLLSEVVDSYFDFLLNNNISYGTIWHPTVSFDFYKFYRMELTNSLMVAYFKDALLTLSVNENREYGNFIKYLSEIKF